MNSYKYLQRRINLRQSPTPAPKLFSTSLGQVKPNDHCVLQIHCWRSVQGWGSSGKIVNEFQKESNIGLAMYSQIYINVSLFLKIHKTSPELALRSRPLACSGSKEGKVGKKTCCANFSLGTQIWPTCSTWQQHEQSQIHKAVE